MSRILGMVSLSFLLLARSHGASAQPVELPEIVVTSPSPIFAGPGIPALQTDAFPAGVLPVVKNAYSSVTVVPRNEIVRQQPLTLGDALSDKPGISATTYAPGGASRPIIRGLDSNRVRIQENGIGVHDVSNLGEDHAVPINPLVADQIEVIRGPATLRYGSQAIGGVVSVDNNRIPKLIPIGGISGQALGGLSSVDRGRNAAASVDAGGGNVAVHADGFKTATDDYQTPLGRQRNSSTDSQGGSIGASYIFDQGFIGHHSVIMNPSIIFRAAALPTPLPASIPNRTRSRSRASIASRAARSRRSGSG